MITIEDLSHPLTLPALAATIGFFDGVHRGHLSLIDEVRRVAHDNNLKSAVITFSRHPRQVLKEEYRPLLLSTMPEKLVLLEKSGIDYCIVLPFTLEMAALTAQEFMGEVLAGKLHVKRLVVGYDHHFGRRNEQEGFEAYCRYGRECGIDCIQAGACTVEGLKVSSSAVRRAITAGDVELAAKLLGYPYPLQGVVVPGEQIGRTLGFPTANIACDPAKMLPADGVYAVKVMLDGSQYKGMLNIGCRPTLRQEDAPRTIEVHLLHFTGNLYRKELTLVFMRHIRGERQFGSLEELAAQLAADAKEIEELNY